MHSSLFAVNSRSVQLQLLTGSTADDMSTLTQCELLYMHHWALRLMSHTNPPVAAEVLVVSIQNSVM